VHTETRRRMGMWELTARRRHLPSNFATRCIACMFRATGWCMCATVRATGCKCFTKQGKFVKEFMVRPETLGVGSVWQFAFSTDVQQKFFAGGGRRGQRDLDAATGRWSGGGANRAEREECGAVSLDPSDRVGFGGESLYRGSGYGEAGSEICFSEGRSDTEIEC